MVRARVPARRARELLASALAAMLLLLALSLPALGAPIGPTKLLAPTVDPRTTDASSPVTFSVTYRNAHALPPDYVRVAVAGGTHEMAGSGTTWKSGVVFTLTLTLPVGTHAVRFEARDAERFVDALDAGEVVVGSGPAPTPAPTPTSPPTDPPPTPEPIDPTDSPPTPEPIDPPDPTPQPSPTATTPTPTSDAGSSGGGTTSGGGAGAGDGSDGSDGTSGSPTDRDERGGGSGAGPGSTSGSTDGTGPGGTGATGGTGGTSSGGTSSGGTSSGGTSSGGTGGIGSGGTGGADAPARGRSRGASWFTGVIDSGLAALGLSGEGGLPMLPTLPTLIGSTLLVSGWMAFSLFNRRRRDGEPPAPDGMLRAAAAMGVAILSAPAPVSPIDPESLMPRWRRPSLIEARKTDPIRAPAPERPRLSFALGNVGAAPDAERRTVRYAVIPLLDGPDELRAARIGELVAGDEVQVQGRSGPYCQVLCPDERVGWVHRTTLGDVIAARSGGSYRGSGAESEPEAENALAALLAARGLHRA